MFMESVMSLVFSCVFQGCFCPDKEAVLNKNFFCLVAGSLLIGSVLHAADGGSVVVPTAGPADDAYEQNDTLGTATVLPSATWLSSVNGLGVHSDEDWYRLDVPSGYERVQIVCSFRHAEGDIDMDLCDSTGNTISYAMSSTDNEYIDFIVPAAGSYYLVLWGAEAGNSYDLWWKGLPTFEDKYEPNNTLATAFAGLPKSTWLSAVDGPGQQKDDDWYQIRVTDPGYKRVVVECTFLHSEGDIDIILYTADGTQLVYNFTATDNESIDFVVPSTGYYYVKVCFGNKGNTYDLRWNTLAGDLPDLLSVAITGPAALNENTAAAYTCTATYSDSSAVDVTSSTTWSENSAYAAISSSGVLSAGNVTSDQQVTITAVFAGQSDTMSVTITDVPAILVSIAVSGPATVDENSTAAYTCTATYSDSSTVDVSSSALWTEYSAFSSIGSNGLLRAGNVTQLEAVTVAAAYEGLVATKNITIVFSLAPVPYEDWTVLEAIPADRRAHSDTPADDGIPNLLKYACGLPAMLPCSSGELLDIAENSGTGIFTIRYFISKNALGVTLEPIRTEAVAGPWLATGITDQLISEAGEREQWQASIPVGACGFMRLRVTAGGAEPILD